LNIDSFQSGQTAVADENATPQEQSITATVLGETSDNGSDSRVEIIAKKRKWTPEEDEALLRAVDEEGEGNWVAIAKKVQTRNART
jgi:hypothetical protein